MYTIIWKPLAISHFGITINAIHISIYIKTLYLFNFIYNRIWRTILYFHSSGYSHSLTNHPTLHPVAKVSSENMPSTPSFSFFFLVTGHGIKVTIFD